MHEHEHEYDMNTDTDRDSDMNLITPLLLHRQTKYEFNYQSPFRHGVPPITTIGPQLNTPGVLTGQLCTVQRPSAK
jgi:hypothetical protein